MLNRFKEASTWRGIIMVVTALGVNISPELMEYIVSGGMAIAGAVGVFTGDSKEQ